METYVLELLECPYCAGDFQPSGTSVTCQVCEYSPSIQNGVIVFSQPPSDIKPSPKRKRSLDAGTPWRRSNWAFFSSYSSRAAPDDVVLDVGAGHADAKFLFQHARYVATDLFPYKEIDFACDFIETIPFRREAAQFIMLSNVLEHVSDASALLGRLGSLLKPGGKLLIAVPFMLKLHQTPYDFGRYSRYALEEWLTRSGFRIDRLEAVSNPPFLVEPAMRNHLRALSRHRGLRPKLARLTVRMSRKVFMKAAELEPVSSIIDVLTSEEDVDRYPIGYHVEATRLGS